MEMEIIVPLAVIIILSISIRLAASSTDIDEVKKYIEERGGTLLEKRWQPFGGGLFGGGNGRFYKIVYRDRDGNEHQAKCMTSLTTGAYWTDDIIVKYAPRSDSDSPIVDSLQAEIRRLRDENARLSQGDRRANQ